MVLHIDFYSKKKVTQTPYNTDDMAKEFLMEFHNSAFTVGQPYVFQFQDKPLTQVIVGDLEITDLSRAGQGEAKNVKANVGLSFPNTAITFEKAEGTSINLIGKSKGKVRKTSATYLRKC